MIYILIASAFIPLIVIFGDRIVKVQNFVIIVPGMLGEGIRSPKELFNGIALIAIIFCGLGYCKLRQFRNPIVIVGLIWAFFISFICKYEFSFSFLFYTFLGFTVIAILSSIEKDEKFNQGIRLFLKAIAYAGLIQCFYATCQALVLDQFFNVRSTHFRYYIGDGAFSHRVVGFVGNPSLLSMYLAIILPIYLYIRERWAYLGFILALLVIYACDSTTGWIAVVVSIMFYVFFTQRRLFVLLLCLLVTTGLIIGFKYYPKHKNQFETIFDGTGRVAIWKKGYTEWIDDVVRKIIDGQEVILRKERYTLGAITGHGLRSWEFEIGVSEPDPQKQWHEAHNDWFQVLYETGVIGFTIYLILIFTLFKTFLINLTKENIAMMSSLVSFGISGLALFPLYSSCAILYAVIFVGLILNGKRGEVKYV